MITGASMATSQELEFLTTEQKQWLSNHPDELIIAPEANYPPFSFVEAGQWRGLSSDFINLVEKKLDIKLPTLPAQNLDSILAHAQRSKAGIVTSVKETQERAEYLSFTQPYVSIPTIIIVKSSAEYGLWPAAFAEKKVAVGNGYGVQKFLERNYPSIKLVLVPNDLEGLRRLSFGEVDAVIMDVASASYFIEREKITNLHVFSSFEYTYDLSFAVRKDIPILRDILSETLFAISDSEKQSIAENWHVKSDPSDMLRVIYQRYWLPALIILIAILAIASTAWIVTIRRAIANKINALSPIDHSSRKFLAHNLSVVIIVFLMTVVLLAVIWQELNSSYQKNLSVSFENQATKVTTKIKERMAAYGQILRGGAGFFAGSETVNRKNWQQFVEKLNLNENFRGIQGVGFSQLIPKTQLAKHIKEIRKQGFPVYDVKPPGDRQVYSSIIYLEPFSDRNLRAFGYDMLTEPTRNEAMSRARDTGDFAISGKVKLVQETDIDIQPGLLAYYPIYRNGAVTKNQDQRRDALMGWVYSPYRMTNLIEPVLENELTAIRLEILDEGLPAQESLLFDSQLISPSKSSPTSNPALSYIFKIEVGGRYWTLRYTALPGYAEAAQIRPLWNELLGLIIIGLLVFSLILVLINMRSKAEDIAIELTNSLRYSEQRWKFALEGAGDGVWDWDIAAGEMIFSKRWYEIQGFDEGTVGPSVKDWEALVHPDDLPIAKQALQVHFEGNTAGFSCEHRVRCKNGEYKWILGRGMVVARDLEGKPIRAIGTHTDITEHKQTELNLALAREQSEAANQAKSLFLSSMSHEMRTPLNAIIGMSYLLGNTRLDQDQKEEVDAIQISSNNLLSLVNDILDISKIEAGELVIDPHPFSLPTLLKELRHTFYIPRHQKQLTLEIPATAAEIPDVLIGDDTRLRQILVNLLNNAIKFTERGCVALNVIEVSREAASNNICLRFTVSDTGIGIPPEIQPTLFQPFTQADSSITRRFGGTGLGLSIVKQLAEAMGGSVGLESTHGQGSTFWVELPLKICHEKIDRPYKYTSVRPLHILIVESQQDERKALIAISINLGWQVDGVDNGLAMVEQVVQRMQDQSPVDCIVMDWGLEGLASLVELKLRVGEANMPSVIIMTEQDRSEVFKAAQGVKLAAVLTKPVHASAFFNAVNEVVNVYGQGYNHVFNTTLIANDHSHWLPGVNVLVVDDSRMNLDVCQRILSNEGAHAFLAESGEAALNLLKSESGASVDIVLMDLQMPGMSGLEATKKIRNELGLFDLPVIALTAGATITEREQALSSGMNDFLVKPINPVQLIHVLSQHVEHARGAALPIAEVKQATIPESMIDWPAIEGVDVARASEIMGGDKEFFLQLLGLFIDEHKDSAVKLKELLNNNKTQAASKLIHKLKGQAGNLGATLLFEAAGALENAIYHSSSEVEKQQRIFEKVHNGLIKSARIWL